MTRGIAFVLIAMISVAGCSGEIGGTASAQPRAGTPPIAASSPIWTSGPAASPTPTATSKFHTFGDGTFIVGTDIQPGIYRTRTGSPGCYWEREKGFGGTVGDIIANDNTDGPAVITIAASDKGFKSDGCGTWTTDLSAIVTPGSPIPGGTYIVGTDLTAGTYRSAASSGCYWERLKGFGGTTNDIIANDNTDAGAIVTISKSDKGFSSSGCGDWTKQ